MPDLTDDDLLNAYQAAGGSPAELGQRAPMRVTPAPGNPSQAIAGYDAAALQNANDRMGLMAQGGAQQAASHDQAADTYGEQAAAAKSDALDARARANVSREEGDDYAAESRRIYDEMSAHANPPGPRAIDRVMAIIGGIAAAGGNGGAAQGAQMIAGLFGSAPDRERWAAEQEHNTRLFQMAQSGRASSRSDEAHHIDMAQRMIAADAHYYNAAINQVKERGLSAEARNAADISQSELQAKTLQALKALEVQKQKAAAAAGHSRQEDYFWRIPLDQLAAMPSQVLGKAGQKVLAERTKQDQSARGGEVDITGKQIGQAKTLAELAAQGDAGGYQKGVGGPIPGLVPTKPVQQITPKDYQDAQQIQAAGQDMNTILGQLSKLQGEPSVQARQEYYNLFPILLGKMNTLANAGVLNPGEVKVWEERLPKHVIDNALTFNPATKLKAAMVDEQAQYGALAKTLNGLTDNALAVRGFARDQGGAQPGGAPAPAAGPKVIMVRPSDGKTFEVDPSKVGKAQAAGLVPQGSGDAPAAPAVAGYAPRPSMASRILGGR